MNPLVQVFRDIVRQNHNNTIVKLGEKVARNFLIGYWNENFFDMEKNGEAYLIEASKKYFDNRNLTVFDVGANHGEWSILVKKAFPTATIHCFEIIPKTFSILEKNIKDYSGIFVNNLGISDRVQEVEVTYFPDSDSGSSIQPLPWECRSTAITCSVIPGNKYCEENKIEHIDLLKIDTEGHELAVLKGFESQLSTGKITLIQFEYGLTYLPARITLGDIYNFLLPFGYIIGRLYPMGVEFKEYSVFEDENFKLGNYIAVHRSAQQLYEQISL